MKDIYIATPKNYTLVYNLKKFLYTKKYNKMSKLHRPKRKMRQNTVMIYIFYNYVSSNLLNVPLLFLLLFATFN
jgi:hypothetical protein